ncbi:MAG: prolyl oligopeptidase family serine peptidase [Ekhidna sp.]|uniref:prolyl oligopeptidase family serine peptidase n=1 Tax=Ekhidna sp. TaxID=2608089 RepID=UPI0032EE65C2
MNRTLFILLLLLVSLASFGQHIYPLLESELVIDSLHGIAIEDPYRFLEEEDPRAEAWLDEQQKFFNRYDRTLVRKQDFQQQVSLLSRIRYSKFGDWEMTADEERAYEFRIRNNGYDRAPDLYMKRKDQDDYVKVLKSKDFRNSNEDHVIFKSIRVDERDKYASIGISHSGSDWTEIFILDLETRMLLDDTISNTLGGGNVIWKGDGFFYKHFKGSEDKIGLRTFPSLKYHHLNSSQNDDTMVFQNPDTTGQRSFYYSMIDEDQLFIDYQLPKGASWLSVKAVANISDGPENFFLNIFFYVAAEVDYTLVPQIIIGDSILIKANIQSPNNKVVIMRKNEVNKLSPFIPEYDMLLTDIHRLGKDHVACFYRKDSRYVVIVFDLKGAVVKKFEFPQGANVSGFAADVNAQEAYYYVESFTHPGIAYKLDLDTWVSSRLVEMEIPYDYDQFEVKYVKYSSHDGVEIPMYIIKSRDVKKNGKAPTLIYGYGGYGRTQEPRFSPDFILWLMNGGVLAIPNVRGGGVEGSDWAKAGQGINKVNTIADFIYAGEYLIRDGYTNSEKMAIRGGSHGGFAVGAVIAKRPELFKAAVASAGAFDMVRFHKFSTGFTELNLREFGNPDDEKEFPYLFELSPYHNIRQGEKYPNLLLMTGDSDDRVPTFHSYKFLARLQSVADPANLYMIKVTEGAGHSMGSTYADRMDNMVVMYLFLMDQLGMNLRMW